MTVQAAASSASAGDVASQAKAFLQQGEFAKAAGLAGQAYSDSQSIQEQTDLLYVLAVAQRYLQQYVEALATLTALHSLDPDHARAWQEQGHTLLSQNRLDDAREAYETATSLNPALLACWQALANMRPELPRKSL